MSEAERASLREAQAALAKNGYLIQAGTIEREQDATTLRFATCSVVVAEGALSGAAETLRKMVVVEAADLNHAIQLMSQLPLMRPGGCVEIYPMCEGK